MKLLSSQIKLYLGKNKVRSIETDSMRFIFLLMKFYDFMDLLAKNFLKYILYKTRKLKS